MNAYPTQSRLRELLNYDRSTGVFTWKPRRGCVVGKPIGCCNGNGYLRITVDGVSCYAHRLAWIYENGATSAETIDHINGKRGDNKIDNLREASPSENQFNRSGAQRNNRHGHLGVYWLPKSGKWQVHIAANKKRIYLGLFADIEMAKEAYAKAKAIHHGISS